MYFPLRTCFIPFWIRESIIHFFRDHSSSTLLNSLNISEAKTAHLQWEGFHLNTLGILDLQDNTAELCKKECSFYYKSIHFESKKLAKSFSLNNLAAKLSFQHDQCNHVSKRQKDLPIYLQIDLVRSGGEQVRSGRIGLVWS